MEGTLIMIFIPRLPCRRFVMPLSSSEIRVKRDKKMWADH